MNHLCEMKIFITISALLMNFVIYGQCDIKRDTNMIAKTTTLSTKMMVVGNGNGCSISWAIEKTSAGYVMAVRYIYNYTTAIVISPKDTLLILLNDGVVIRLLPTGIYTGDHSGTGTSTWVYPRYSLDQWDIGELMNTKIKCIQIQYNQQTYSEMKNFEESNIKQMQYALSCIFDAKP